MNNSYSPQQLKQIIALGLRQQQHQQNNVNQQELYEIAEQSGLNSQQTEAAIKQWQAGQQLQRRHDKHFLAFKLHAISYLSISVLLFMIDWVTGGVWWFFWPILGMGMGLLGHALKFIKLSPIGDRTGLGGCFRHF
ncbi:2TM domain-containing protein [Agarivorans sp. 1_MG-2023]|uniref:2TM domain-containing protein n=1 Tax=Agarivorans sp. 1_MG-2023 TaxID=3062634 RepID=UPI0026E461F0|nr:2TM domain-containing protein [Agarivorans sp. 1_MG-2023]MDO6763360.1 2TM domain-containing protein [Agarivorans sp. 1_MG-2023]